MPWLCGGLLGSGLVISAQAAWARPVLNDMTHFLVAQQVVDGLPPPPPLIFGQEPVNQQAQAQTQQYLVVVSGDSQMLLSQVQQVQPAASMQDYNGQRFIQAGLFADINSAQQQVNTLAASGITAQVMPIASATTVGQAPAASYSAPAATPYDPNSAGGMLPPPEPFPTMTAPPAPGEVEFGAPPDNPPDSAERGSEGSRSYYVIIPGGGRDIDAISTQIARLTDGMGIDGMIQPGSSRGKHVRVGPFNSRSAANRWTRYFRDFGMDARVGYSR